MTPERNLAVQTAVIARARARSSAPTAAIRIWRRSAACRRSPSTRARTFKAHHLHVAQRVFERLGGAPLVPLDVARRCRCVRLALAGRSPAATRMKILFLMDSPEYLRFYDSAIEELAVARPRGGASP